jgi:hypothetical protein
VSARLQSQRSQFGQSAPHRRGHAAPWASTHRCFHPENPTQDLRVFDRGNRPVDRLPRQSNHIMRDSQMHSCLLSVHASSPLLGHNAQA